VSHQYSVETVVADVGWVKDADILAIREVIGEEASVQYDRASKELHLGWNVHADSMSGAIDRAHAMHHRAEEATGVFVPHSTLFQIREVADH
jgi:hypothetical protein